MLSRILLLITLWVAISLTINAAPTTTQGPTISNAGGVALSAEGTQAFVVTTAVQNAAVYVIPLPYTAASNSNPTAYFTSSLVVQYYYIAASKSNSPQLVYLLDNQNAQLVSLAITTPAATATTTIYNFSSPNVDLIDGMYYQASTNLLYFACYGHFSGAVNDFIGVLDPSATTPTLTTFYTTNLVSSLAGIAVSSQYLYYATVTDLIPINSVARVYRVAIPSGAVTIPSGTAATVIYTSPNTDPSNVTVGNLLYPAALVLNAAQSILYITDIGYQDTQPEATMHAVYALSTLTSTSPMVLNTIFSYIGENTEVQQSFALAGDQSTLYWAATGDKNGMYITSQANSSITLASPASVLGDPMFVGLRGQRFQVHGLDGGVYNLINDRQVVVNARFTFLSDGRCPTFTTSCWTHPGSYLGEMGFTTAAGGRLVVRSGGAEKGFTSVEVNGEALAAGAEAMVGGLKVVMESAFSLTVTLGNFELVLHNSDRFVNLASVRALSWAKLSSHGLLGQTWRAPPTPGSDVREVEGLVDDYLETTGDLVGNNFMYRV